jgi:hypothetical protein
MTNQKVYKDWVCLFDYMKMEVKVCLFDYMKMEVKKILRKGIYALVPTVFIGYSIGIYNFAQRKQQQRDIARIESVKYDITNKVHPWENPGITGVEQREIFNFATDLDFSIEVICDTLDINSVERIIANRANEVRFK